MGLIFFTRAGVRRISDVRSKGKEKIFSLALFNFATVASPSCKSFITLYFQNCLLQRSMPDESLSKHSRLTVLYFGKPRLRRCITFSSQQPSSQLFQALLLNVYISPELICSTNLGKHSCKPLQEAFIQYSKGP